VGLEATTISSASMPQQAAARLAPPGIKGERLHTITRKCRFLRMLGTVKASKCR
jgi:hypothetical protein